MKFNRAWLILMVLALLTIPAAAQMRTLALPPEAAILQQSLSPSYGGTWKPDSAPSPGLTMASTSASPDEGGALPPVSLGEIRRVKGTTYFVPLLGKDEVKRMEVEIFVDGKFVSARKPNVYDGKEWKESPSFEIPVDGIGGHRVEIYQLTNYTPSRLVLASGEYTVPQGPMAKLPPPAYEAEVTSVAFSNPIVGDADMKVKDGTALYVWADFYEHPGAVMEWDPSKGFSKRPSYLHLVQGVVAVDGRSMGGYANGFLNQVGEVRGFVQMPWGEWVASPATKFQTKPWYGVQKAQVKQPISIEIGRGPWTGSSWVSVVVQNGDHAAYVYCNTWMNYDGSPYWYVFSESSWLAPGPDPASEGVLGFPWTFYDDTRYQIYAGAYVYGNGMELGKYVYASTPVFRGTYHCCTGGKG